MRVPLLLAPVLLALFAGCSGGAALREGPPQPSATFTEDTGGIEGSVVDDEFVPVAGANVTIVGNPKTATTNAVGRFAIGELVPGTYLLVVKKDGFKERQTGVTVPTGNVTQTRIILEPIPAPVPYADSSYSFVGFMRHSVSYRVGTTHGNFSGYDAEAAPQGFRSQTSGTMFAKPGWQTILVEVTWDPPTATDEIALRITFGEKQPNGNVFSGVERQHWVASGMPVKWRFERETMIEHGKNYAFDSFYGMPWKISLSTNPAQSTDYSLLVEKKFTLFGTIGYNGPLDAAYTRLPS